MDEKENTSPQASDDEVSDSSYELEADTAKLAEVEQIIDFYKDIPDPGENTEPEAPDTEKKDSGAVFSRIENILRRKTVVNVSSDAEGDLHDAEYGINKKGRLVLGYIITAALCGAIIGGSFLLAAILPGDKVETDKYIESLRTSSDYTTLKSDYDKLSAETYTLRGEVAEKKERSENIDDYENTQAELRAKTDDAKGRLAEANTAVNEKQSALDELDRQISEFSNTILTLPPGRYTAGKDIAVGKYAVTGTGTFAVASEDNSSKYNTTLGSSPHEITLNQGDKLKFDSAVKFAPVM